MKNKEFKVHLELAVAELENMPKGCQCKRQKKNKNL